MRTGETLQSIARIYHTSVALLKKINYLTNDQVSPDQGSLVPLYLHQTYSASIARATLLEPAFVTIPNPPSRNEENLKQFLNKIYKDS